MNNYGNRGDLFPRVRVDMSTKESVEAFISRGGAIEVLKADATKRSGKEACTVLSDGIDESDWIFEAMYGEVG